MSSFSEFEAAPSVAFEEYWSTLCSNQGVEPSATIKRKRMAKWYQKNVDAEFDPASIQSPSSSKSNQEQQRSSSGNNTDNRHSTTTTSSTGSSARASNTNSSMNRNRNTNPSASSSSSPPTSSLSIHEWGSQFIEFGRTNPVKVARLVLHSLLPLCVLLAVAWENYYYSWYNRTLLLFMVAKAADLSGLMHIPSSMSLQGLQPMLAPIMTTEQGQLFLYALFMWIGSSPSLIFLCPLIADYVIMGHKLYLSYHGPGVTRVTKLQPLAPRVRALADRINALKPQIYTYGAIFEIAILPLMVYRRLFLGLGGISQILAYGYTFLNIRYVTKQSHRSQWARISTRLRDLKQQHGYRAPVVVTFLDKAQQLVERIPAQAAHVPVSLP